MSWLHADVYESLAAPLSVGPFVVSFAQTVHNVCVCVCVRTLRTCCLSCSVCVSAIV